jgi:hypothetical protein
VDLLSRLWAVERRAAARCFKLALAVFEDARVLYHLGDGDGSGWCEDRTAAGACIVHDSQSTHAARGGGDDDGAMADAPRAGGGRAGGAATTEAASVVHAGASGAYVAPVRSFGLVARRKQSESWLPDDTAGVSLACP